ncbi:hypothetical protein FSP39_016590 [Pinctada imbricata]|uniref:Methyltransferase type 11 domain-containing protein n=1 Tax=Pinctada imbricata TaxID=66713 RepID=A0AA88YAS3_PINIB|nr:hypothetical protein FSP39_016590 [Pinctada imbricata]
MAESDLTIKSYILWKFMPFSVVLIMLYIVRKRKKKVAAWMLSRLEGPMNRATSKEKKDLFQDLNKLKRSSDRPITILEIGPGTGPNFSFYPKKLSVTCLDPNDEFNPYLLNKARREGIRIEAIVRGFAEKMTMFDSDSFDAVVSTFVLCSVRSQELAVKEIKRVLKNGGKFYFLEHISSEKKGFIYLMQRLLNPVCKVILDGCQVIRDTPALIQKAGFSNVNVRRFDGKRPFAFIHKPLCIGYATK